MKKNSLHKYKNRRKTQGPKSKLTPERTNEILRYIRLGSTYNVAAQAAGVGISTFKTWVRRGREEKEGKYYEFYQKLLRAEAQGEVGHLNQIRDEGALGSKWILARRYPERWSNPDAKKSTELDVKYIAKDIVDTVNAMFRTVPLIPEELPND